jgi:phage tail sheath protein FI
MPIHVSPGVSWKEIDQSNYIPQLSNTIVGLVGTANKGPVNTRLYITTPDQFIQTFGTPSKEHFGVIAALEYLKVGNQLWFTRVESSGSPAKIATVKTPKGEVWSARDPGSYYNDYGVSVSYSLPRQLPTLTIKASGPSYHITYDTKYLLLKKQLMLVSGKLNYIDNGLGSFSPVGDTPALKSSSINYDTGELNIDFGTTPENDLVIYGGAYYTAFNVVVLKFLSASKTAVVEAFYNMNLIPESENFYANKLVSTRILANKIFTEFPELGTYQLNGGTDGLEGIADYDFIGKKDITGATGLQNYAIPEEIDVNIIAIPGQTGMAVRQALESISELRQDSISIIDPPLGLDVQDVIDWADGANKFAEFNAINSTYSVIYYSWFMYTDTYNKETYYAPPSCAVLPTYAKTEYYEVPAGPNRGKLTSITKVERPLSQGERDLLYSNRINPITDLSGYGITIFGQKTASKISTSLDRVAARRTLIVIEKSVTTAVFPLLFEPNNFYTWRRATRMIQPFLDYLVTSNRIYEAQVVCDSSTNTPVTFEQNQMIINVYVKLMKYAEMISLNFVVVPTGASINEYYGNY